MTDPIISVEKLRVIYNQGKSNEMRALEETNLRVFPHEYIIIFGPSGCGKSTLLYSLSGLQRATYGEVTVKNISLSRMTPDQELSLHQSKIGMIFQAFYLIPSLTIIDNVCLPKMFRGEHPTKRRHEGIRLLRRFGIAEQADKFPNQLSGGQKQRVAIARALINNPDIILADEPVGNLDSESAENVLTILNDLNETDKKTVIMVTHNPEHLVYADRVLHMKDGMIVDEEVREEKRPADALKIISEEEKDATVVSGEFKMLLNSFKNLSPQQTNILLTPFKAKQLFSHILSNFTEEQTSMAQSFLNELLFNNISIDQFTKKLDADLDDGGAGWNKKRAISFTERIRSILAQSKNIQDSPEKVFPELAEYLSDLFHFRLDREQELRFRSFVKQRIESKINQFELLKKLDASVLFGGVGMRKNVAEKVTREIEMIMLLKYS